MRINMANERGIWAAGSLRVPLVVTALSCAHAQVGPPPSGAISLSNASVQTVGLPAGSAATLTNVVVDSTSAGGDLIDAVVGDPAVIISLITPSGTEITSSNAGNYGYTFNSYTADGNSADTIQTLFTAAGTHTFIQFPSGALSGNYQVKANTTAASSDTAMFLAYYRH